ncbi:unnamed protein product [Symbiodinium necroappetens]|uniref:Uncharacterized protein n=1 Tax=Symbiodinium necroappetens TaxID=1628268 RepID=A0A812QV38_9DINO|nr:unnamed protein product [Symbiodinium necroappetens]
MRGQGKGKNGGQRRKDGRPAGSAEQGDLVTAMARLVHRHDEQLMALTTDLGYISYVRTDAHSVLPELHEESKRHRAMLAPAAPPRHAMTLKFLLELRSRVLKVGQSATVQQKIKHLTSQGEWPYFEWSPDSQTMVETLEDPLSTSQLLAGIGDVIARLEADTTQVTLFKASRPITDKMSGATSEEKLPRGKLEHSRASKWKPEGSSFITQVQMLIQGKAAKIKAQLMMLAVEVLAATKVKQLHSNLQQPSRL